MEIEKKTPKKYPKFLNGFGNFFKSALARLAAFPSILLKWSITSLNGLFSSVIRSTPIQFLYSQINLHTHFY